MQQVAITETNRFSTFVKGKDNPCYKALVAWQKWFTKRGIPSVIARPCYSGYALYREGLVGVDKRNSSDKGNAGSARA